MLQIDFKTLIPNMITQKENPRTQKSSKIHLKNVNLQKAGNGIGIVGERQSKLIDKLTSEIARRKREVSEDDIIDLHHNEGEKQLLKRIQFLQREEVNLKREMIRISEMSKNYKNSRIQMEIKHESMLIEYSKCKKKIEQLQAKILLLTQLNTCLLKITQNSLQILPQYEDDCNGLFDCISKVKEDFKERGPNQQSKIMPNLDNLLSKLQQFKSEVDKIQNYQKKLINQISDAYIQTKSINQRLSVLSNLDPNDIITIRSQLNQLNDNITFSQPNQSVTNICNVLTIQSSVHSTIIIPESQSRISKIFQQITLLFEHHIHLLQTQKMQYQFTKNKKLIACQKYQCEICESYQKIVSHIFSIVREAFKQIKFQFLREIKQINDISEIPFLI